MSCSRRKPFLKLTTNGDIDHSGGYERHLLGTDQDPVPMCIAFVRSCCYIILGYVSCVFKSIEPLSFDSPVESGPQTHTHTNSHTHTHTHTHTHKGKYSSVTWTDEAISAFFTVKEALANATLLVYPKHDVLTRLQVDASEIAVGAVLQQQHGDVLKPLGLFSRRLQLAEVKHSAFANELLAIYLSINPFNLFTNP